MLWVQMVKKTRCMLSLSDQARRLREVGKFRCPQDCQVLTVECSDIQINTSRLRKAGEVVVVVVVVDEKGLTIVHDMGTPSRHGQKPVQGS